MAINSSLNPEKVREQIRFAEMHENLSELKDIEQRVENFVKSNEFAFLENTILRNWNNVFQDANFTRLYYEIGTKNRRVLEKEFQEKVPTPPGQLPKLEEIMMESFLAQLQFDLDKIKEVEERVHKLLISIHLSPFEDNSSYCWKRLYDDVKIKRASVEGLIRAKEKSKKELEETKKNSFKIQERDKENGQWAFEPLDTIMTWFWGENWKEIFEQKAQESQEILIKNLQEEGIDLDPYDSEQETTDSDSSTY